MDDLAVLERAAPGMVSPAERSDAICGVAARAVGHPRSVDELAALVGAARTLGLAVIARGARTKLDWGMPPERVGLVLDTSELTAVLEHAVNDLVVRVEAGIRVAELQALLATQGQRLPIDEVVPGSTVGGVVATGLSGPLRMRYGSVRDLLIGVSFVRGDGVVAKSGAKVVKNVAGYDLAKLLAGSYGTLAVITEAIFRLRPLPNHAATVVSQCADERELDERLVALRRSVVAPSAVEVHREGTGPIALAVLLEGAAPTDARAADVVQLLGRGAAVRERPSWWGALPGETTLRAALPLTAVSPLLGAVATLADAQPLVVSGSAGAGVVFVGLGPFDPTLARELVDSVRATCTALGGSAVVLRCPPEVRARVDVWGPAPGVEIMRRIKAEFDPDRLLSPGRFVGGI